MTQMGADKSLTARVTIANCVNASLSAFICEIRGSISVSGLNVLRLHGRRRNGRKRAHPSIHRQAQDLAAGSGPSGRAFELGDACGCSNGPTAGPANVAPRRAALRRFPGLESPGYFQASLGDGPPANFAVGPFFTAVRMRTTDCTDDTDEEWRWCASVSRLFIAVF
jgi:hypothetical protein